MTELVFLLEEKSAKALLESLLPRLLTDPVAYRLISFEGKSDLEKSLVRKIRAYQNPAARFIILRDQDSAPDCMTIKRRLLDLCAQSGKADQCRVRIACTELETFYLGDLRAVEVALGIPNLAGKQANSQYKFPDRLMNPSNKLKEITRQRYQKVTSSRQIGVHLDLDNNRSSSFRSLVSAIKSMAQ